MFSITHLYILQWVFRGKSWKRQSLSDDWFVFSALSISTNQERANWIDVKLCAGRAAAIENNVSDFPVVICVVCARSIIEIGFRGLRRSCDYWAIDVVFNLVFWIVKSYYVSVKMDTGGAYGGGKAGGAFDPQAFIQRPPVIVRAVCWVSTFILQLWPFIETLIIAFSKTQQASN